MYHLNMARRCSEGFIHATHSMHLTVFVKCASKLSMKEIPCLHRTRSRTKLEICFLIGRAPRATDCQTRQFIYGLERLAKSCYEVIAVTGSDVLRQSWGRRMRLVSRMRWRCKGQRIVTRRDSGSCVCKGKHSQQWTEFLILTDMKLVIYCTGQVKPASLPEHRLERCWLAVTDQSLSARMGHLFEPLAFEKRGLHSTRSFGANWHAGHSFWASLFARSLVRLRNKGSLRGSFPL